VPEISRFFGIIIRMFMEAGATHHTPHFHAYYQEHVGALSIDPVELIAGDLPRTQRRLVEAWAELHREELKADWDRLRPVDQLSRSRRYNRRMNAHPVYRVTSFERVGPYALRVEFDDGLQQTIEFSPVLAGDLYRPLRDPELFGQVRLDPEVHTLVWPNGADFDPATLHDWPLVADDLRSRARAWAATATFP
jgi:hypothetical protein